MTLERKYTGYEFLMELVKLLYTLKLTRGAPDSDPNLQRHSDLTLCIFKEAERCGVTELEAYQLFRDFYPELVSEDNRQDETRLRNSLLASAERNTRNRNC